MPLPAFLGPAAFGGPAAAAAAKHAAVQASIYTVEYLPAFSSASLTAVLARLAWKRVPNWIREDVSFRRSTKGLKDDSEGSEGEMERLSSVIEKLQALAEIGSAKLGCRVEFMFASVLIYFQLAAQHKLLSPETRDDLFHASGNSLSDEYDTMRRLKDMLDMAVLAYYVEDEKILRKHLDPAGFSLQHRSVATTPGSVGFFVAVSETSKTLLIGIKGTSSLEDLFTDSCGRSVTYNPSEGLQEEFDSRIEVRAQMEDRVVESVGDLAVEVVSGHERILFEYAGDDDEHHVRCHEGIFLSARRVAEHVHATVARLVVDEGYTLVIVGHSLGAGAASLLAMLLRSRFPALTEKNIEVYAFAPPPVLDLDAAVAATPYVTSIINNADIIPRSSLANLAVFLEFLRSVSERLQEVGLAPTGPRSTAKFLRKLAAGLKDEPLMTLEEVRDAMNAAHDRVELHSPDHLYVPGRVLLLHENWATPGAEEGLDVEQSARTNIFCSSMDGTAKVLRLFEIDGYCMLGDHTTASYSAAIDKLLQHSRS